MGPAPSGIQGLLASRYSPFLMLPCPYPSN